MRKPGRRSAWLLGLSVLLLPATLWSQAAATIRGSVTGTAQQPLSNAQVGVMNTRLGSRTNASGAYTIAGVPAGTHTVRVQMIGYGVVSKQITVTAGQNATLNFQLSEVALALNEIVITGTAGEQTRRSQPAQVAVLNASEMLKVAPKVDMANVLQSKMAGVEVTQGSGATGAAPRIRIRGASSISLSNDPLVFVDGIRIDSRVVNSSAGNGGGSATSSGGQGVSRLNDLNPEDIESIEVVKGPAAATLYGADASAGVIQIITKKGATGSFSQNVLVEGGLIDVHWTPPDNWGLCTAALINAGQTPVCQGKQPNTLVSDNPWIRENIFKTGHSEQANWSGSGGTQNVKYFLSLGNLDETGVYEASNLRRATGLSNTTLTLRPDVTLNVSFKVLSNYSRQPDDNHSLYGFGANAGIGSPLTLGLANNGWLATRREAQIVAIKNEIRNTRFVPTVTLSHQPASWFNQRLVIGADFSGDSRVKMVPKNDSVFYSASDNVGFVKETRQNVRLMTADYLGHATHDFNSSWNGDLAFGTQVLVNTSDLVFANGTGLATNAARVVSATAQTNAGQSFTDVRSVGYLGQGQIGFRNRIFLQAGLRIDRNSSFGSDVKSMVLPKAGASWVLSDESWFRDHLPQINLIRLRSAYGVTGRAPLAGTALETWSPSPAAQSGTNQPGLDLLNPGNPHLKPERGSEVELGVDASFFRDRIGTELTYFKKTTNDLILQRQLPPSQGYAQNPYVNIGSVENDGVEAAIHAQLLNWGRNSWDAHITMSTLHNELTDLGDVPAFGTSPRYNKGYPLASFFARRVHSVDVAKNLAVVSDTNEYMGTQFPSFSGSFNSNVTILGNLRIAANFDWKRGYIAYNATREYRTRSVVRTKEAVMPTLLSDDERLRLFGPYVDSKGATVTPNLVSEPFMESGDFLRFRELAVTYTLPARIAAQFRATRASLTAGGRNLNLWKKYLGPDPEALADNGTSDPSQQFGTSDFFNLPPSRRFFMRVTFDF